MLIRKKKRSQLHQGVYFHYQNLNKINRKNKNPKADFLVICQLAVYLEILLQHYKVITNKRQEVYLETFVNQVCLVRKLKFQHYLEQQQKSKNKKNNLKGFSEQQLLPY